jgi:hypothetical protein
MLVGYLPRSTASRVGYHLGKSDRFSRGSRVVSTESFVPGWVVSAVTRGNKKKVEVKAVWIGKTRENLEVSSQEALIDRS